MEFKKAIPYDIVISASPNNGFLVKVGCVTLPYTDPEILGKDLAEYLKDPKAVEKQYNETVAPDPTMHYRPGAVLTASEAMRQQAAGMAGLGGIGASSPY